LNGLPSNDDGHGVHGGFRADWDASSKDLLTVEGDLNSSSGWHTYSGFISLAPPFQGAAGATSTARGGDVLGRWTHTFSPRSDMALQTYFDSVSLENFGIEAAVKTTDFDFQHHIAAGQRNDLVWGVGTRTQPITISSSPVATFNPSRHTAWLASAFVQDEIEISDSFRLTVGAKVERNDVTGNNMQPSIRAAWSPNNRSSVWAAVSRALRAPSRVDTSVSFNLYAFPGQNGLTDLVSANGNPQIRQKV
jgi:iron complex outermembrane recepter protein